LWYLWRWNLQLYFRIEFFECFYNWKFFGDWLDNGTGGGAYLCGGTQTFKNVNISDNSAIDEYEFSAYGGGIYCNGNNLILENVTICGNSADIGDGIYNGSSSSNLNVLNSILWDSIHFGSGLVTATFSDVLGGWAGIGNIDSDPLFVDADNDDYFLQSTSPCIGAGDPDTDISDYETDLDGNYRIKDAVIDMGAYEYQSGGVTIQNTIAVNNIYAVEFSDAGMVLQFTENHNETIINATKYNSDPGIVGNLPSGVEHISTDRYWNLYSTEGNVGNYNVTFDLSGVSGIQNFNTLHILKRNNPSSSWQDVVLDLGLTLTYNNPFITVNVLTAFSDFAIGAASDNSLPVTLSSFAASYANGIPTISWTTQSESNNLGWNIYRSENENSGQSIQLNYALILGAGTTSQPTNYIFEDGNEIIAEDTYWYYLESVSNSGETESYGPISLSIPDEDNDINGLPIKTSLYGNYPNPFNPITKIQFDIKENETGILSIYNIKGQIIESHQFESGLHNYIWNASVQSSGMYLYKLETESVIQTRKMLLLK